MLIFRYHSYAAAAKSLQSCPTLCDPIDGRPPGSPVPGILQARTLEWVAISFSKVKSESEVAQSCLTLRDPILVFIFSFSLFSMKLSHLYLHLPRNGNPVHFFYIYDILNLNIYIILLCLCNNVIVYYIIYIFIIMSLF